MHAYTEQVVEIKWPTLNMFVEIGWLKEKECSKFLQKAY
jgi:hypothetical protein